MFVHVMSIIILKGIPIPLKKFKLISNHLKKKSAFYVYSMKVHEVQCCFGAHWLSLYGQNVLISLKYLLLCSRFGTTSFTHQSKPVQCCYNPLGVCFFLLWKTISIFCLYNDSEILCCFGPQWQNIFFFVSGLEQQFTHQSKIVPSFLLLWNTQDILSVFFYTIKVSED